MKPRNHTTDQPEERVSKSQRKRESSALQAFGAELADLPREQLETLPLPENVLQAIEAARSMKQHGAHKRQIKYIGGLLRTLGVEPIREALDRVRGQSAHAARQHHRIERWRDRLLVQGDEALMALVVECPAVDQQQIRQLIRTAHREADAGKPPQAARGLYGALRELLK